MRDGAIRAAGIATSIAYAAFVVWVYASQPQSVAQIAGGMAAGVGAYRIDQKGFDEGLRFFRTEKFAEARAAFARADPASRDPTTQFYIAYSFYRQGWGRMYNDDALFQKGLAAVDHAIAVAPGGRIAVNDSGLRLRTADELRAELVRGLTRDVTDLDPRRLLEERK